MPDLNFAELIDDLEQAVVAPPDRPVIWGGECAAADLADFLKAWKLEQRDMPWRLWEWVSDIAWAYAAAEIAADLEWLERGRLFGSGGDLELRRDADRILWRFVGPADAAFPAGFDWEDAADQRPAARFLIADYWRAHTGYVLHCRARSVLLWGQEILRGQPPQPTGVWQEDRVAGVKQALHYPTLSGQGRERRGELCYWEYLHGDNVEAVWWRELRGWQPR